MTTEPSSHPDTLSPDTVVVATGRPARVHDAAVNPPIVLSSTYVGTGQVVDGDRAYGRYSNPTWDPLEQALSELEGAELPGLVFSSGLAAVSAALSIIPVGGVLVMPRHSYQGALVMAQELAAKGLFSLRTVDIANNDEVIGALTGSGEKAADMLWLESPTNPMLEVADLHVLCRSAQAVGAVVVTDNTFCTPLVQKPLDLGSDVVLHSVTKYLAGHSDVILGALVTSNPELRAQLLHHRSIHGAIAGPFEAWLALRGLRTLALRVERAQASAMDLAQRLETHDGVDKVLFPGLDSDPGHDRAKAQMLGFGSVLCIEVAGGEETATALVEALRLWTPATSLGGVESLIERRRRHANEPDTVPANLLRLSVGIENVEDLWNDLAQALEAVAAQR
ncbi:cystathionine gamma-synthase (plasmid) [Arthrobacter sp. ERGS1:01]|uniref:trans-sulfuration enzyme family protein n=1 Tax=Arthrobacter sp. ERGS1:01 TaxID=1704044 RepID=UPI0006B5CD6B|nr:aminotransferase class I/II-fold pyridoxal phosphate-dependent enzyme [Arthrobacter sp. ERGS1:01]ALE04570.1 cystathionine gamma-synthase [Arthrobacter sp. ERGS1:01]